MSQTPSHTEVLDKRIGDLEAALSTSVESKRRLVMELRAIENEITKFSVALDEAQHIRNSRRRRSTARPAA